METEKETEKETGNKWYKSEFKGDTVRIYGYLNSQLNDELEAAAKKYHVTKSVMIGLAIQFGLALLDKAYPGDIPSEHINLLVDKS